MLFHKKLLPLAIAIALGVSSVSMTVQAAPTDASTTATAPATNASRMVALPDFTPIVQATENSVVNIRTEAPVEQRPDGFDSFGFGPNDPDEIFKFFFGPDFPGNGFPQFGPRAENPKRKAPRKDEKQRTEPTGVGSGFIISSDGYIITNNHVVDGATKVIVTLNNSKEYDAKVIGTDKRTDIALLKINAKDLKPLEIGDSDSLKKGQWVLAIGSPYGLDSTVTSGIVSAINRDTGDYLPFVQTDVPINPGNSGGPLIDLSGKVVGVNSQIYTRSGGFMGISFSIPINEAMHVVEQLKATGKVERGRIGVMISEVKKEVADALGLKEDKGALVSNIEPKSPAEKAGIKSGDVILSFANRPVNKWSDLPRLVGLTKPGTTTDIEVWRRGKLVKLKITLDSTKDDKSTASKADSSDDATADTSTVDRIGLSVKSLDDETKDKIRVSNGVVINEVEGDAADMGIQKGDVLVAINDQDITSVSQYKEIIKKLPKDKAAALLIRRENLAQWVTVTPSK
ncbi:Do family serine endopeptidase [Pelistega europaea]|uniref:Probable periplasmic serine endoprotease DegP-like n=1 Tax=Pelistega europaea TaxID=106147 RepID=A0A7Y4LC81_9BURK|nr:Do family serine endopeptidase [Pelistega europaea]NOL49777.1 Do family serine endopeptidase [Pelistega europaea]